MTAWISEELKTSDRSTDATLHGSVVFRLVMKDTSALVVWTGMLSLWKSPTRTLITRLTPRTQQSIAAMVPVLSATLMVLRHESRPSSWCRAEDLFTSLESRV